MEKMRLQGILTLKFFKNDELVYQEKSKNMIVDTGYTALFSGLGGTANKSIVKVQCGSNSAVPTTGDTAITDPVDLAISGFTASISNLIIKFTLGANDANGLTIAEFGTICVDGTLFSRVNWTPFLKISDLSVEGTWTISRV